MGRPSPDRCSPRTTRARGRTQAKEYHDLPLGGTIGAARTLAFAYPANGIQNGAPDGVALVDPGSVRQFLSYEGTFNAVGGPASGLASTDIAVGGPANGLASTDIAVAESGSETAGQSLQLRGTGMQDTDFTWAAPTTSTFGAANTGQTFGTAGPPPPPPGPSAECGQPATRTTRCRAPGPLRR